MSAAGDRTIARIFQRNIDLDEISRIVIRLQRIDIKPIGIGENQIREELKTGRGARVVIGLIGFFDYVTGVRADHDVVIRLRDTGRQIQGKGNGQTLAGRNRIRKQQLRPASATEIERNRVGAVERSGGT